MVELGIPELTTEQTELLCQTTEAAAKKAVPSKVPSKLVNRLDICVEVEGTKPIDVSVEVDLVVAQDAKSIDVEAVVQEAVDAGHKAVENFLRKVK